MQLTRIRISNKCRQRRAVILSLWHANFMQFRLKWTIVSLHCVRRKQTRIQIVLLQPSRICLFTCYVTHYLHSVQLRQPRTDWRILPYKTLLNWPPLLHLHLHK